METQPRSAGKMGSGRKILLVPSVLADRCTGCEACVEACSLAREGAVSPARSRIRILRRGEKAAFQPLLCLQCVDPPCLKACPSGAREVEETTGLVRVVESRCIGCRACVRACPVGAVWMKPEGDHPLSCDGCGGEPACTVACSAGALRFRKPHTAARRGLGSAAIVGLLSVRRRS